MISKNWRRIVAAIGVLVLLAGLLGSLATRSEAANLTSGNTTYVINGDEVTLPFDPVTRKEGLLLPAEAFQELGIAVSGLPGKEITLSKGDEVTVILTVGSTVALVDGAAQSVATAPLRLSGRTFLPADVLKEFGVDVAQDGSYVFFRNYGEGLDPAVTLSMSDWSSKKAAYTFYSAPKADSSIFLTGEFTLLTPELLNTTNLGLDYGTRVRLLNQVKTNTLVLVKLSNDTGVKSGALTSSGLYLVDGQRHQYDLSSVMDIGNGLLTSKLAPGADRVGVLVFPPLASTGTTLSLYYDPSNGTLGTFRNLH